MAWGYLFGRMINQSINTDFSSIFICLLGRQGAMEEYMNEMQYPAAGRRRSAAKWAEKRASKERQATSPTTPEGLKGGRRMSKYNRQ